MAWIVGDVQRFNRYERHIRKLRRKWRRELRVSVSTRINSNSLYKNIDCRKMFQQTANNVNTPNDYHQDMTKWYIFKMTLKWTTWCSLFFQISTSFLSSLSKRLSEFCLLCTLYGVDGRFWKLLCALLCTLPKDESNLTWINGRVNIWFLLKSLRGEGFKINFKTFRWILYTCFMYLNEINCAITCVCFTYSNEPIMWSYPCIWCDTNYMCANRYCTQLSRWVKSVSWLVYKWTSVCFVGERH